MTAISTEWVGTGSTERVGERNDSWALEAIWLVAGLVLFFVVPWLGTDVGDLNHDLHYLVYITATMLFLNRYVQATGLDVAKLVRRRWRSSAQPQRSSWRQC